MWIIWYSRANIRSNASKLVVATDSARIRSPALTLMSILHHDIHCEICVASVNGGCVSSLPLCMLLIVCWNRATVRVNFSRLIFTVEWGGIFVVSESLWRFVGYAVFMSKSYLLGLMCLFHLCLLCWKEACQLNRHWIDMILKDIGLLVRYERLNIQAANTKIPDETVTPICSSQNCAMLHPLLHSARTEDFSCVGKLFLYLRFPSARPFVFRAAKNVIFSGRAIEWTSI